MTDDPSSPIPGHSPISVAILAGGLSTRMGTDKALLRLEPAGPTLLERVIDSTSRLGSDRFIVSRAESDYPNTGLPVIADRYPGMGVLGAIGTALHHAAHQRVLVVSCDMPFLNHGALAWMAGIEGQFDAIVPVTYRKSRQGGSTTYQTLHAIYRKTCLPAIEAALHTGHLRSIAFLARVMVREVCEDELKQFDPQLRTLLSVNSPEDLAFARRLTRKGSS
jgi:molybdopterin-guanine dinucleotide biosynthesis protein A